MSTKPIDIANGKAFEQPFRFYLFAAIICVGVLGTGQYLGLGFLLIPLWGLTSKRGTEFRQGEFRRYFSVFGLRFGSWEAVQEGEEMVLLRLSMSAQFGSHGGQLATTEEEVWMLYIVNAQHRDKRGVGRSRKKLELEQKAAEIAEVTTLKLVPFAPVVSQQTRMRRRR